MFLKQLVEQEAAKKTILVVVTNLWSQTMAMLEELRLGHLLNLEV